eukprot:CAMPEP_0114500584 /NCGR_PEP_ID=MMETSP0109-20121206/8041_1 /TAXON_ID=29199 /ORGANISM="Chlorarachnion reptans, Strain CCCM449" /LENGTH=509 /DNA_ID=CAMNT_0001678253 /DNA_START=62 /DNA_END=1588 /DNA_ORIENTATION=-
MNLLRTPIRQHPKVSLRQTAEARHWDGYKRIKVEDEHAKISCVSFAKEQPFDFAVAASARVRLFSGQACAPSKIITRFKDNVHAASLRSDGAMLAAAGDWPVVKVFETQTKAQIREFRGHSAAVQAISFLQDDLKVASGSDDKTCKIWDVPQQEEIATLKGHTDCVRAICNSSITDVITGGYDHKVKGWDLRDPKCTWTIDHEHPVEAVLALPTGSLLATAGGRFIKIWDLTSGGRLIQTLSNHQKAVTCLCHHSSDFLKGTRLIAGSLDQQLKFYDLDTFEVNHSIRYPSPILSCGISDHKKFPVLVVGMLSGALSIKRREAKLGLPQEDTKDSLLFRPTPPTTKQGPRVGSTRYYKRGVRYQPTDQDAFVANKRKKKLQQYDYFMHKFQYKNALDAALQSAHPNVVTSVLDELMQREGLKIALADRDDKELLPVLSFIVKHVTNPHHADILVHTANIIIKLYGDVCRHSSVIDDLLIKLKGQIKAELKLHENMLEIVGSIQLLASNN